METQQLIESQNGAYSYRGKDLLGKGAFADVFRGVSLQTNQSVAIKVINKSIFKKFGQQMKRVIESEVQILARLRRKMKRKPCKNIIKIQDCFETESKIYIVLEYCGDGTLDQLVKTKLSERETINIAYQIAKALHYLGEDGIAHRDLKPQNIFIKGEDFKIGDFGFAAQKDQFVTMLGTFPYMAPQILKQQRYDGLVDIWSLGVITHELLFGQLYFRGGTQKQLRQRILNKEYVVERGRISPEMYDFIRRCLEKDPNSRMKSAQILDHPLFRQFQQDSPNKKIRIQIKGLIRQYVSRCEFLIGLTDTLSNFVQVCRFVSMYSIRMGMFNLNVFCDKIKVMQNPFKSEQDYQLFDQAFWKTFIKSQEFSHQLDYAMGKLSPNWKKYCQEYNVFKDYIETVFSPKDASLIIKSFPMSLDKPLPERLFNEQTRRSLNNLSKLKDKKGLNMAKYQLLKALQMNEKAFNFQRYLAQKRKWTDKDFEMMLNQD